MIEIVPATQEMLAPFYGEMRETVRALAVLDEGKVIGLTGFTRTSGSLHVFAFLTDELKKHPRHIIKAGRRLLADVSQRGIPVRATRDAEIPTSEGFLRHFGFERIDGEIFQWR